MKQITAKHCAKPRPYLPVPPLVPKRRSRAAVRCAMVLASDHQATIFRLSGGQAHDALEGRVLLESWNKPVPNVPLAMDRACNGEKTSGLVETLGMTPVVPPKANRNVKWDYDR